MFWTFFFKSEERWTTYSCKCYFILLSNQTIQRQSFCYSVVCDKVTESLVSFQVVILQSCKLRHLSAQVCTFLKQKPCGSIKGESACKHYPSHTAPVTCWKLSAKYQELRVCSVAERPLLFICAHSCLPHLSVSLQFPSHFVVNVTEKVQTCEK